MRAEILTIGAELLAGDILDTNFTEIARALRGLGIVVSAHHTVADDEEAIAGIVGAALGRVELVLVTGGLGPTPDDRTRGGVARAMGVGQTLRPDLVEELRAKYLAYGHREMPESNLVQVTLPDGAVPIPNPRGTAPGFRIETDRSVLFAVPGIPREMRVQMEESVLPWLRAHRPVTPLAVRTVNTMGIGESQLVEDHRDLFEGLAGVEVAFYPQTPGVRIKLTASGEGTLDALDRAEAALRGDLERWIYGVDDETLAGAAGRALLARGWTVATAESITGGGICALLVSEPGASRYVDRGVVAYANRAKVELCGVPEALIAEHGAVSEPVARAMAEGLRERAGVDVVVAVTGVAGPDGGSPEKPVGLVHSAIAAPDRTRAWRSTWPGTREMVIRRTIYTEVNRLRRAALKS